MNDETLIDDFSRLAACRIGLRVPDNNRFIETIRRRAADFGDGSLSCYRDYLAGEESEHEWEEIARQFTSGETFFFRDHGQIDLLSSRLLPELIARHRDDKTLRIWSAGSASGEEAYSLAMLVDMLLPQRQGWNILILGTDIDPAAIHKARLARYGNWSFRQIPPNIQSRYFHADESDWVLNEAIRDMVSFRVSNLMTAPFPDQASELHDMDLILCRNVFIYFDRSAVSLIARKFAATLREGAYLLTAHTELLGYQVDDLHARLCAEGMVYQKENGASTPSYTADALPQIMFPPLPQPQQLSAPLPHVPVAPPQRVPDDDTLLKQAHASLHARDYVSAREHAAAILERNRHHAGALDVLARLHADRGEYDQARQVCNRSLAANPLIASPYFVLAQLAQLEGDFDGAKSCLNKTIYLEPDHIAANLELAALFERDGDVPRAIGLRRTALGILRKRGDDDVIEPYEMTAAEMTQWLSQWLNAQNAASQHPG